MDTETPKPSLPMRKFTVRVAVVRPVYETALFGGDPITYEDQEIEGYTLKDAKRRAGVL